MGEVDGRQSRGGDVHTSSPDSIYLNLTRKCSENHRGFPNTKRRTAPPLHTTQRSLKFVDKPNNGNRKTTEDRVSFFEHVVLEKTRHVRYVKRKRKSFRNIGEASSSLFGFLCLKFRLLCSVLHDVHAGVLSSKGAPFLPRRIPIPMMVR
jgi:hypothetical protein